MDFHKGSLSCTSEPPINCIQRICSKNQILNKAVIESLRSSYILVEEVFRITYWAPFNVQTGGANFLPSPSVSSTSHSF